MGMRSKYMYFNSRNQEYRSPFGAVAEHTAVHFRVKLPRERGVSAVRLVVGCKDAPTVYNDMFWAGQPTDGEEWWECHFTPETAGIYRYYFEIDDRYGKSYLSPRPDGSADYTVHADGTWQLTCYMQGFATPDWLAGGIMYQIFPDRFAKSGKAKQNVPADRVMRDDWGGVPVWEPDAGGRVWNNDFFGGDFTGITEKLPYLQSLGVTCIYLNPVFESHSNHRYDTADYEKIDPLLGDEKDFAKLCKEAKKRGIRVILDGVFSHTGADSRYFNKDGRYGDGGAYRDPVSPYTSWYHFNRWPNDYGSWWGFETLPEVEELSPAFSEFITGDDGIISRWIDKGAGGWRLDVADELPDAFIRRLRVAVKKNHPDKLLLGEVWEDASNKESYGHLRAYLLGEQLDSVMNYPFREAILHFLTAGNAERFFNCIEGIVENYPPQVTRLLMNHIGTHDTLRAITALAGEPENGRGRRWQANTHMAPAQYVLGVKRLKCAAILQYCLPGVPCVYYGDEAGLVGYRDPFNRGCYPWGDENAELLAHYRALGEMRKKATALAEGTYTSLRGHEDIAAFLREADGHTVLCAVNMSDMPTGMALPQTFVDGKTYMPIVGDGKIEDGVLSLPAVSGAVFLLK